MPPNQLRRSRFNIERVQTSQSNGGWYHHNLMPPKRKRRAAMETAGGDAAPPPPRRNKSSAASKGKKGGAAGGGGGRWPPIKPKKDLQINRLKGTHLLTVPNFFTAAEAKAFVDIAENIGFTHQGSLGPLKGEAYRDNDRISVTDPLLAQTIWESGMNKIFEDISISGKVATSLNSNIRFYRYTEGQRFGRHIDESVDLGDGSRTLYTLLIYLSGKGSTKESSGQSLVGGETVFYDHRGGVVAEVAPVQGMALLHLHGAKCMLHEARVVKKNIKYVLRSDVAFA
uniref:Fe2OG dioxygenase domain-containing protein n=2 Tax=Oryza brachyantha TaxID=4533 RepID=J3LJB8_ORYBR